jgi:hypothetical protein
METNARQREPVSVDIRTRLYSGAGIPTVEVIHKSLRNFIGQSCQGRRLEERHSVKLVVLVLPFGHPAKKARATRLWRESNQSLLAPGNSRRENVCRGQRPGRRFRRHQLVCAHRDSAVPRLRLQSHGKIKTLPTAARNRLCGRLRGGAGRIRTCNQPIMERERSLTAVPAAAPMVGPMAGAKVTARANAASPIGCCGFGSLVRTMATEARRDSASGW